MVARMVTLPLARALTHKRTLSSIDDISLRHDVGPRNLAPRRATSAQHQGINHRFHPLPQPHRSSALQSPLSHTRCPGLYTCPHLRPMSRRSHLPGCLLASQPPPPLFFPIASLSAADSTWAPEWL
eukprot:TRINITY_DN2167_c0_g1_i2.p2 TRINITY_DN2167_c0_g1~~TRINITY_DN2167_c0_g1_i2.p2  ORF type:complete len:126 (+),score=5.66 TRINITY_DN2167_c0_g1_i2:44-421(+)